jgi:hypothetical protein
MLHRTLHHSPRLSVVLPIILVGLITQSLQVVEIEALFILHIQRLVAYAESLISKSRDLSSKTITH